MGLTATIQSAVSSMFNAFGDLVSNVILVKVPSDEYDPDLGYIPNINREYVFTGIFDAVKGSSFENTLVDFNTKICYLKPNTSNPDPVIGDKIKGLDGIEFTILDIGYNRPNTTVFVWELLVKS